MKTVCMDESLVNILGGLLLTENYVLHQKETRLASIESIDSFIDATKTLQQAIEEVKTLQAKCGRVQIAIAGTTDNYKLDVQIEGKKNPLIEFVIDMFCHTIETEQGVEKRMDVVKLAAKALASTLIMIGINVELADTDANRINFNEYMMFRANAIDVKRVKIQKLIEENKQA